MARQNLSRRQFLTRSGLALGGVAIAPAILAACGGGSGGGGNGIAISNWTSYIGKKSNADFTAATGITVAYTEDVNDNNEYFAKIQPNLQKGKSIGRDGFVLTDWMAARLIRQGFVESIDKSVTPNVTANLLDSLKAPNPAPEAPKDEFDVIVYGGGLGGRKPFAPGAALKAANDLLHTKAGRKAPRPPMPTMPSITRSASTSSSAPARRPATARPVRAVRCRCGRGRGRHGAADASLC